MQVSTSRFGREFLGGWASKPFYLTKLTPNKIGHEKGIWKGSHNLILRGRVYDHHGYKPLTKWDEPPSSWWLSHPVEKYAQVKLDHFPKDRGKNQKSVKPPTSNISPNWIFFLK